ncbi:MULTISPECIES: SHOCT domain-containing protein [Isoptericola]|nr:SHOCT domain-containing protein [Isoptericola halotolerans]
MIAQLERLGQLRDNGVLTDAEFAAQKARLLAG